MEMMEAELCEKCHRHHGNRYAFYFGNKIPIVTIYGEGTRYWTKVAGSQSAPICKQCISRAQWKKVLIAVAVACVLAVLTLWYYGNYKPSEPASAQRLSEYVAGFLGFDGIVGAICILSVLFGSDQAQGESMAIAVKKKVLEGEGFNTFMTVRQHDAYLREESKRQS